MDCLDPRYSRQRILSEVGEAGQERLHSARVLIVGLGGLVSPVSLYLAAAGVGTLGLADPDRVDQSNLHRQILYGDADEKLPKTEQAAQKLRTIHPSVQLETIPEGITPENALTHFRQYDLIIDGTDNFPSRYLINDAAHFAKKPVIHGSIFQHEGQITLFDTQRGGPCYRCLFPQMPSRDTIPNCAEAGVLGPLCGIIGSWQAMEAIKYIIGLGESLSGTLKIINTLSNETYSLRLQKKRDCPLCGESPEILEINKSAYSFTDGITCSDMEDQPIEIAIKTAAESLRIPAPPIL